MILRHKLKHGVEVIREYGHNLPRIEAYGSELNQVWTNILDNAIDAMQGHGVLCIRTYSAQDARGAGAVVERSATRVRAYRPASRTGSSTHSLQQRSQVRAADWACTSHTASWSTGTAGRSRCNHGQEKRRSGLVCPFTPEHLRDAGGLALDVMWMLASL